MAGLRRPFQFLEGHYPLFFKVAIINIHRWKVLYWAKIPAESSKLDQKFLSGKKWGLRFAPTWSALIHVKYKTGIIGISKSI